VVPEPVDKWQNVDGKGGNMLDEFYSNPQRFAYTFQNYVFVTRVMQVRASLEHTPFFSLRIHSRDQEEETCQSAMHEWPYPSLPLSSCYTAKRARSCFAGAVWAPLGTVAGRNDGVDRAMPLPSQERDSQGGPAPMRLLERSVFSDRMVFVRAVHEARYMSDLELSVYDSWFEPIVDVIPTIVPDGFIYLQADPDTCMRRLIRRQRAEEKTVRTAPYLHNTGSSEL